MGDRECNDTSATEIPPAIAKHHAERTEALIGWWNRLLKLDQYAALIVLASFLDSALEHLLRVILLPNKATSELLKDPSTFGSFSNKVKLCQAFGLLDEQTLSTLSFLNKMRNFAAHSYTEVSLDKPPLSDYLDQMPGFNNPSGWKDKRRDKLLFAAEWCSHFLEISASYLAGVMAFQRKNPDSLGIQARIEMTVKFLNVLHKHRNQKAKGKNKADSEG